MTKRATWFILIIGGVFILSGVAAQKNFSFEKLLGQVGVVVGVAPNPYNTLDAQLNQKQAELDQQQADLAAREAALASTSAPTALAQSSPAIWYLAAGIFFLAFLVILNFYLDWRRSKKA